MFVRWGCRWDEGYHDDDLDDDETNDDNDLVDDDADGDNDLDGRWRRRWDDG